MQTGVTTLYERVLSAMTAGITLPGDSTMPGNERLPAGEPITAAARETRPGAAEIRYYVREYLIATRTFQVDEPAGDVILGQFTVEKYEDLYNRSQNITAIHERFAANLAGDLAPDGPCVLRTTVSGAGSVAWAPYFDWDSEMANANAANIADAVESLYPVVSQQTVWDASGLPERVRLIAAPVRESADGEPGPVPTWRQLLAGTTPGRLADGIDAINRGLARAVFARITAWYGQRVIS